MHLLSDGCQFIEFAQLLGLGTETVRSHLKKAQSKLGVHSRRTPLRKRCECTSSHKSPLYWGWQPDIYPADGLHHPDSVGSVKAACLPVKGPVRVIDAGLDVAGPDQGRRNERAHVRPEALERARNVLEGRGEPLDAEGWG